MTDLPDYDLPLEYRWDAEDPRQLAHAITDTHRGLSYCGRQTDLFGGATPRPSPEPPMACRGCLRTIRAAERRGEKPQ